MLIERPNATIPTPQEIEDLTKLKAIIERAVADGKITQYELNAIKAATWADGKVTPQELDLYRELILSRIRTGELEWEY